MTNRDWAEIENELNGLVPGLPKDEERASRDYSVRQASQWDEKALLAHIADALVQEQQC